jgi:hypothetical protein
LSSKLAPIAKSSRNANQPAPTETMLFSAMIYRLPMFRDSPYSLTIHGSKIDGAFHFRADRFYFRRRRAVTIQVSNRADQ